MTDSFGRVLPDAPVSMSILIGDTTADKKVGALDIQQTKGQVGVPVTASNFRDDVNLSGAIDKADISSLFAS